MNLSLGVLAAVVAYCGLLFVVAWWFDRAGGAAGRGQRFASIVYALSIGVYCTSWTYYGSVGRAAQHGIDFLPIYLGPTLTFCLGAPMLAKILRICRAFRITSIADFIASRYGKSALLAGLVTLVTVAGSVPYIALQLQAVASTYALLMGAQGLEVSEPLVAFCAALLLACFAMLFGTHHIDRDEHHHGMVVAIAFEAVVKLVCFAAVGLFAGLVLFHGFADLFAHAAAVPDTARLLRLETPGSSWTGLLLLSAAAAICLPRQFQTIFVENRNEVCLRRATWGFPLYLILINLFVLPVALAGLLLLPPGSNPDTIVLELPLAHGAPWLAVAAFIGGLSAATGMVVVESVALSTMVCNDLVMPALLRLRGTARARDLSGLLLDIRRGAILGVLLLGLVYQQQVGETYALVSIGLVSFAAAAQLAPALLLGLFWHRAGRAGALAGIAAGFAVWAYTLFLPSLALSGVVPDGFVAHGLFGLAWTRPQALFGLDWLDPVTHALFWSMLANIGLLVGLSVLRRPGALEAAQAVAFVRIFAASDVAPGRAPVAAVRRADLLTLLARFTGAERASSSLAYLVRARGADPNAENADPAMVQDAEMILAGVVGSASADVLVASVVGERPVAVDEVMRIVDESARIRDYSHQLELKQRALELTTEELRRANDALRQLDRLKDEFVSTVSHELRTPLTSIRGFAEILADVPDLEADQRAEFLGIIIKESERLTRLITDMLDLARMQAGEMRWTIGAVRLAEVVADAVAATGQIFRDRRVAVDVHVEPELPPLRGDADRLTQVVINLLSNAAKFCPEGTGRVEVSLAGGGGMQMVTVTDNGPGISVADQAVIFEKFRQASDDQLTRKPSGTGLGLAICRTIVEHHGGTITVESTPGHGASFRMRLPVSGVPQAAGVRAEAAA